MSWPETRIWLPVWPGAVSQEQKDRLLVQLVTKNREKLLDKGNRAARDKGIGVQLCDVAVQKL